MLCNFGRSCLVLFPRIPLVQFINVKKALFMFTDFLLVDKIFRDLFLCFLTL